MELHCIGAFDHQVDEYVGSPQMIGFVFARDVASLPASVCKVFDMDCEATKGPAFHASLKAIFGEDDQFICLVRGFYGSEKFQLASEPTTMTLKPVVTFAIEFEKATLEEYLKTGLLTGDPPVFEGKTRDFRWEPNGTWAWTSTQWEAARVGIYIDGDDIQLSFFGNGCPDEFLSPKFSAMTIIE